MKKIYLSALAISMAATVLNAQTVVIEDDFESYDAGPFFGEHWNNWKLEDNDTFNIIVSTDKASSGTKSGFIGVQNEGGGQDALLLMETTYSSGTVTAEWKMYQPAESNGYFNLQETTTPGESFGYEAYLNRHTDDDTLMGGIGLGEKMVIFFTVDSTSYVYAYGDIPIDEWFTVKQVMNLGEGTISIFINDTEVEYYQTEWMNNWPGDMGSFGAFDFFSILNEDLAGPQCSYYIDDVKITTEGVGINQVTKNNQNIQLYPNPTSDFINIKADEVITYVEIYNISGQLVNTVSPNSKEFKVNTNSLPSGVYTAKIMSEDATSSKQFVVR